MALGFVLRALAQRWRPRAVTADGSVGQLDFSFTPAGALIALLSEDF